VDVIDNILRFTTLGFMRTALTVISTVCMVLFSTPMAITVIFPIFVVYVLIQVSLYRMASVTSSTDLDGELGRLAYEVYSI